jgi:hypothetical protein
LLGIGRGAKNKERKDSSDDFLQHDEENPENLFITFIIL